MIKRRISFLAAPSRFYTVGVGKNGDFPMLKPDRTSARVAALLKQANERPSAEDLRTFNDTARRYVRLVAEEAGEVLDDPDAFDQVVQLLLLITTATYHG